jgi:hypothetical protein
MYSDSGMRNSSLSVGRLFSDKSPALKGFFLAAFAWTAGATFTGADLAATLAAGFAGVFAAGALGAGCLAGAGLTATALFAGADDFFVTAALVGAAALLALALPATGFAALVAIKDSIK